MKQLTRIFGSKNIQRGTVLIEFLLTIALAGTLMPFIYGFQMRAITRADNVRVTREMQKIQSVLEHYIVQNKDKLLTTVGRNIIRIKLSDLVEYGLDETFVQNASDKYQLRILKSNDVMNQATLQGVVVLNDPDITPMRTREIVSMGDDKIGFIDGTRAYGGFGTWRATTADFGIDATSGIIQTTSINRDNSLYLWRVPSDNPLDATMMSGLNLGGRDIANAAFVNAGGMSLTEIYESQKLVVNDLIFKNRTTIDADFKTQNALVSGTLSGDAKTISVAGTLNLADLAKVSSFTADNLWTNTLSLSGLSVSGDDAPLLRVTGALDMTEGRVNALYVTVGFTGSITPRIGIKEKIVDSTNPAFYWDAQQRTANFVDISSPTLSNLATKVLRRESVSGTTATRVFSAVTANKNATMGDFMNAISEIQNTVRGKYRMLNLE